MMLLFIRPTLKGCQIMYNLKEEQLYVINQKILKQYMGDPSLLICSHKVSHLSSKKRESELLQVCDHYDFPGKHMIRHEFFVARRGCPPFFISCERWGILGRYMLIFSSLHRVASTWTSNCSCSHVTLRHIAK